jgi:DNA-binding transcriptional ArsR family regulator
MLNNHTALVKRVSAAIDSALMPRSRAHPIGSGTARSAAERRRLTQQLRALAHPLRLRLLEHFGREPRTTMQVAALLGEPPTRLYHHVNALVRAGILRLERTRQVRGTTEKYFTLAQHRIATPQSVELTPHTRAALSGLATTVFEQARAELLAAVADPRPLSRREAPLALRMLISVPPSQQARVRRHVAAMIRAIKRDLAGSANKAVPRWALTLAFAPTQTNR